MQVLPLSVIGKHVKIRSRQETFNKLSAAGDAKADRPGNSKQVSEKNTVTKKDKVPHTPQNNIVDHFQHIITQCHLL